MSPSPASVLEAALAALLPPGTGVAALVLPPPAVPLPPAEAAATTAMAPGRRAEFAAGRYCARLALARLGVAPVAIPVGAGRAPVFPPGTAGTISHGAGLAAAAAARAPRLLGIDIEAALDLPAEIIDRVCAPAELDLAPAGLAAGLWARVVFSAKESVYKAVAGSAGRFIDFDEVRVTRVAGGRLGIAAAAPDLAAVAGLELGFRLAGSAVVTGAWA
jgi:4'-phosphopantetheinyl transferase EntD